MKLNITFSTLIFVFLLTLNTSVYAAQAEETETEQDTLVANGTDEAEEKSRWFQVEIIVFKPKYDIGMEDESWDKKLVFNKSESLIDFLQPYYLENDASLVEQSILNAPLPDEGGLNDSINDTSMPNNPSIIDINSIDEEARLLTKFNQPVLEKPFVPLTDDLLELSSEAKNLARHSNFEVLTHLGWRQPMVGKNESSHIRIAGGQDLSSSFAYDGSQLKHFLTQENESALDETNNLETETFFDNEANSLIPLEQATSDYQSNLIPQIIPMLWVPELDGDIKIYLNRYLHIQTNLFLRKPGKEVLEAIDLDLYDPELLNSLSTEKNTSQNESSELSQYVLDNNPSVNTSSENQLDSESILGNKTQNFSWEISDSFLTEASEKIFVERLFNYSVKQSRRVRSGELHYFDHPLLGLIILITPYELPVEPAGNLNDIKN